MDETGQPLVRPDVAAFLAFLSAEQGETIESVTPERGRELMRQSGVLVDVDAGPLSRIEDITIPGPAGDIPARIFDSRPAREPGHAMVFFHGGGFVIGDLDTHAPWCAEAARQLDMPVIAVDYRLAPENPFPAAVDDCEAAARWVAEHIPNTGLVFAGDSAGGNLSLVIGMALSHRAAATPVRAIYALYPVVTHKAHQWASYDEFREGYMLTAATMRYFTDCYAADADNWRASPLDADLAMMPPTLVHTASLDPLRDQGRAFAAKLIEAGVATTYLEAAGTIHGFINFRRALPSAQADVDNGFRALKAMLGTA